jgi:hypothetical protein
VLIGTARIGSADQTGRSEALAVGVEAWLTDDQTHVVKIARRQVTGFGR